MSADDTLTCQWCGGQFFDVAHFAFHNCPRVKQGQALPRAARHQKARAGAQESVEHSHERATHER